MKYINISPGSIYAVFSNTKYTKINDNDKSHHIIASTYFADRELIISYENLIRNIKILGLKRLIIFYVLKLEQDDIDEQYNSFVNPLLEVSFISFNKFTLLINSSNFNYSTTNKECLYIFYEINWFEVIRNFKSDFNVTISGGSNVKRHLLSPIDLRLSSYIFAMFNLNSLEAIKHNDFSLVDKDRYLPYIDYSNKSSISVTKYGVKSVIPLSENDVNNKNTNDKSINDINTDKTISSGTSGTKISKTCKRQFHLSTNCRLYSTKTKESSSWFNTQSKRYLNITASTRKDRVSFLSNCYRDIEKLLHYEKHDSELQNKIENYLFDSENYYLKNKSGESLFSLDFSGATSKWIIVKYERIVEYLDNMLNNNDIIHKKGKLTLIQQNLLYTKQVLEVLGSKKCANILISFFLDLVSDW